MSKLTIFLNLNLISLLQTLIRQIVANLNRNLALSRVLINMVHFCDDVQCVEVLVHITHEWRNFDVVFPQLFSCR